MNDSDWVANQFRLLLTSLLGNNWFKGTVHFEIDFWYVLAYLKGIQDVGLFVSPVFSILIFLGQTVGVYQSYNGDLWVHLKEHAQRSPDQTWFNDL